METLVTAWRKCKKSFFNGNQDFHFTIDEGRHDKSLPLRCLLGRSRWREGRAAVMLISVLSQEQLHRRSPVPVLGAREVRAEGVKPQGSLGLGQPWLSAACHRHGQDQISRVPLLQLFWISGCLFWHSNGKQGSPETIANLVMSNYF